MTQYNPRHTHAHIGKIYPIVRDKEVRWWLGRDPEFMEMLERILKMNYGYDIKLLWYKTT